MTAQLVRDRLAPIGDPYIVTDIELTADPIRVSQPRWYLLAVAVMVGVLSAVVTLTLARPQTSAPAAAVVVAPATHVFRIIPARADTESDASSTIELADGDLQANATFMLVVVLGQHAQCEIDVDGILAMQQADASSGYVTCLWIRPQRP